jgi:nitric oxide dioxygenase
MMGTCQLQAVREELIVRMTGNKLIDGWVAADQQLSNLLIEAERLIYDDMAITSGGLADRSPNQE